MNNILNYFYDNNEYNENFNCEDINRPFEDYLNYDQLLAYYLYERDQRVINTAIHDAKKRRHYGSKIKRCKDSYF